MYAVMLAFGGWFRKNYPVSLHLRFSVNEHCRIERIIFIAVFEKALGVYMEAAVN